MEISIRTMTYGVVAFGLLAASVFVVFAVQRRTHEKEIVALMNEVASRDKTIEERESVYAKLAIRSSGLASALDSSRDEVSRLKDSLKKNKEDVLAADALVVKWKRAYEAAAAARESEVPGASPDAPRRLRVDFEKDFGYVGVSGHTLTSPPEAFVKVQQNRPLKLTLVVSRDPENRWRTRVSSSEENVAVDVELAAVDLGVVERRWYERIGLDFSLGISSSPGVLAGLGTSVNVFSGFDVGPAAWIVAASGSGIDAFYGASVSWRPFEKAR